MNMRLPIAFLLAGGIGIGAVVAAINAEAQQSPQSDPASTTMPRHDRDHEHWREFSAADRAAFFDARVAALHAGLTLTPDQDKLWPSVETALRDAAKTMADRRKLWKDQPRPADPVQFLQRASEGSLARGEALKKLADAAGPLYATLNDEQKHRLPILLAHLRPHRQHFAEASEGEHRFGPEGGEQHGWWSHEQDDHDEDRDHHDHSEH
jgi:hypothetical protein